MNVKKKGDDMYTIVDVENNRYEVVKIGDLYWTTENLKTTKFNDGTEIKLITGNRDWEDAGENNMPAYCYYNNDLDNKNKYGALYNFHTVSTGKLAPEGWRVPTNADWTKLENYLISSGYNWDGSTDENKIAKSMAVNTDWKGHKNNGAIGNDLTRNNKSGFSALPGGYRDYYSPFNYFGSNGHWWSATEYDASRAYNRYLYHDSERLHRDYYYKGCGFSVRVVRDV
jgi:uncharacterized protein (TIGR02145 family)